MSARGGREAPNNKSSIARGDVKADNNRSSAAGGDRDAFSNMINSAGGDSEVVNKRRCSSVGWAERLLQDLRFERGREALSTAVVVVLEGPGRLLTMMQAAVLGGGGGSERLLTGLMGPMQLSTTGTAVAFKNSSISAGDTMEVS